ncbi:MAG: phenylalanine--tRNA ligase subunit beta [Longicatena sp.]
MIISRKWLQQYVDVSAFSIEELADKITSAGLEVEGIEKLSCGTNLVIGEVLDCSEHSDSDHLHVCHVNVGDCVEQIVCGAPNVRAGIRVIVARVGALLPGGEIKAGVIRGVESNGMICSLLELGVDAHQLSEESKNGIEILDADAPIGNENPLAYLGLDDELLDIGLTPNRNDCMAAWSMALEVGAILHQEVKIPYGKDLFMEGNPTKLIVRSETDKCPIFLGKVINQVTLKPSPKWMRELLHSAGMKSINNVVDISNIVMLETGQPLHFYDIDALPSQEICVKDQLTCDYNALDGEVYHIQKDDIMITSENKPIGIAGIMGGNDSKIEETTRGIIIEAASFHHVSIRNSARNLNLNSDASIRYQKGIEPTAIYKAMNRAIELLITYADAKEIEVGVQFGSNNYSPIAFHVNIGRINTLLGTDFSEDEVISVLDCLHLAPSKIGDDIQVSIPSYRSDLLIEADIAEEVIRILGYDRLPSSLPTLPATVGELNKAQVLRRKYRSILCSLGYNEALSYSLISKQRLADSIMPQEHIVELASPMSEERRYVRDSILPSLLDCIAYNQARSMKDIALFEISNVYGKGHVEERLAVALSGALQKNRWQKYSLDGDFYTMKGLCEALLESIGFEGNRITFKENTMDIEHFHPFRSAQVFVGKELLGILGQIHPKMAQRYDIQDTYALEINLEVLLNNKASKVKYNEVSKYPSITRDLAFVVSEDIKVGDILKSIKKNGKLEKENIIQNVEVFDVYMGEHIEEGYKSIALTITFQSFTKTLKDQDINAIHERILETLKKDVNAELRG